MDSASFKFQVHFTLNRECVCVKILMHYLVGQLDFNSQLTLQHISATILAHGLDYLYSKYMYWLIPYISGSRYTP